MPVKQESYPEILSIYYLNPGQNLLNTKAEDRKLALIAPSSVFNRFENYTEEQRRAAIIAEEQEKRLPRCNFVREMPKNVDNKLQTIHERLKQRKLLKEKEEEIQRKKFIEEMNEKKKLERAKVMQEAKRLLLYRQPQCRIINGALLTSECIRELNDQRKFELQLKEAEKQKEVEYDNSILNDVAKFKNEETKKSEEQLNKKKRYRAQLIEQIYEIRKNNELLNQKEKHTDEEDLNKMAKDLELIETTEKKNSQDRRLKLKRLFLEALEEKATYKKQQQMKEIMQDQAIQTYAESTHKIKQMLKAKQEEERKEHFRRGDLIINKLKALEKIIDPEEEERKRILEEKEAIEMERLKNEKEKKIKMKLEINNSRRQELEAKENRLKEEQDLRTWETLERIKKNKFDSDIKLQEYNRNVQKKKKYAEELQKQMLQKNEIENEYNKALTDASETEHILNVTNKRILEYANEVIEESKGVRPLFPIIKAIEKVKKEIGIISPKKYDESEIPPLIKKKRKQRPVYVKNLQECQIHYFG